jgi:trimethylamine---corrinoid protein Co-methyltransferase
LKKCPPAYTLAARDPQQDLPLDGNHVCLGTDGCGVEVIDIHTKSKAHLMPAGRPRYCPRCDATEEVAFHWVPVSAQDAPVEARGLHELKAVWENSTKHVQTESIYNVEEAKASMEMAMLLAGGKDELRKRPVLSLMQCTAPPLGHDGGSLDAALIAAEHGIPTGFMTMASCMTTGPVTMAGNTRRRQRGSDRRHRPAADCLPRRARLLRRSTDFASDPRTGVYTGGGPEDFLFGAATNVLADFYNIPLSMGSFATGAKEPNWQAGLEGSLSTFMASVVMSDMLLGCGFLHGSRIWSYAEMMMDCEIFSIIEKMMQGIVVDEETLALEAIAALDLAVTTSPRNTPANTCASCSCRNSSTAVPTVNGKKKGDDARDWALEKARKILKEHQPDPLDEKISKS